MNTDYLNMTTCEETINSAFIKICNRDFLETEELIDTDLFLPELDIRETDLLLVYYFIESFYGIKFNICDIKNFGFKTFNSIVALTKTYL